MYRIAKFLPITFAISLGLSACGPTDQEAKKLGFTDANEMVNLQAKGFKTKEDFAKSLGFNDLNEYTDAISHNISTPEQYQEYIKERDRLAGIRAKKLENEAFLAQLHKINVSFYYEVAMNNPNSETRDQANKRATTTEAAKEFDQRHRGYLLTEMECNALSTVKHSTNQIWCALTDEVLPIYATLKLPPDIKIEEYYEKDKFLFSGTVQSITYAYPNQYTSRLSVVNANVDVDVSSLKNLSAK